MELDTWQSFKNVCKSLFRTQKSANYKVFVQRPIVSYLKVHIFYSNLFFLQHNAAELSDEHSERLKSHIDIDKDLSQIENQYKARGSPAIHKKTGALPYNLSLK